MDKEHKASIDGDQWAQCVRDHGWLWNAASVPASATLILAHGAGAPMDSGWMSDMAARLATHGVNVLRFEFPYMAQRRIDGGKRPRTLHPNCRNAGVRCMSWCDAMSLGTWPLAASPWAGEWRVCWLMSWARMHWCAWGIRFYAVGKPEKPRVEHLAGLKTRTLIVQGERDALGNRAAVEAYTLAPSIEVFWLAAGDHDLKPLKASGFTHEQHLDATARKVAEFFCEKQDQKIAAFGSSYRVYAVQM